MYGIQTQARNSGSLFSFENDVKMYGIQTESSNRKWYVVFENDVKMYGIQTVPCIKRVHYSLRMM